MRTSCSLFISISGLQNDRKALLKEIEDGLSAIHDGERTRLIETPVSSQSSSAEANGYHHAEDKLSHGRHEIPFLSVSDVSPSSPAALAVCTNDLSFPTPQKYIFIQNKMYAHSKAIFNCHAYDMKELQIGNIEKNKILFVFQGLENGDLITQFGSITSENYKKLNDVAEAVAHSQNHPLNIQVKREDRLVKLSLTPQTWSGRGLLGCKVNPLK